MEKLADISGFESLTTVTGNSIFNFSGGTKVSRLHAFNEYEDEEEAAEATEHGIPSKFRVDWPAESDWYRKEPHEGWDSVERGLLMKIMGQQMVDVGENTFNMGVDMLMDEGVSAKEISQYTAEKLANLSVNRKLTAQLGLENLVSDNINNSRTHHRNKVSLVNRGFGGFGGFDLGSRGGDVRERKHLDEGIESRHLSDEKQPVHGGTLKELHISKVTPVDGKYGKWASEIPEEEEHIAQGDWAGFAKAAGIDVDKLLGKNY